jgi:hypothetical protein
MQASSLEVMAPETGPCWQFMVLAINENLFRNLWPQKLHHSVDFWFQILGPEIAKMVQFLGPETTGIWLFLDLFVNSWFSFPPGLRQYKVLPFCF